MNLPIASDSTHSLRSISESVDRICRQLKQLKFATENPFILTTIKSKLPRSILTRLIEYERSKPKWTSDDLRDSLRNIIAIREDVMRSMSSNKQNEHSPPRVNKSYNSNYQRPQNKQSYINGRPQTRTEISRSFPITHNNRPVPIKPNNKPTYTDIPNCLFCNAKHWSSMCDKVTRREDRTKRLTELNRCFTCLRLGHRSPQCRSGRKC